MARKKNTPLSHIDRSGNARMVDVSRKKETQRVARAVATVRMTKETFELIHTDKIPKGDVFAAARIAGILAAKNTPNLIPLCHPLPVTSISIDYASYPENNSIEITSIVRVIAKTGVEMEALTAVSIAALTIYDMCKAVDKEIVIQDIYLLEKRGGKSGTFTNYTRT